MRLENTDRFRNKFCRVIWKDGFEQIGIIRCVPNCSEKYDYHKPGWFLSNSKTEKLTGFVSKNGNKFDAVLKLDENKRVVFDFTK